MPGNIRTIYSDKEKTNAILPRTKVEAITDSEGNSLSSLLSNKQDSLVSGTNIKTINNESILGSGNLVVGGSGVFRATYNVTSYADIVAALQGNKIIIIDNVPASPDDQSATGVCSIIVGAYQIISETSQVYLWGNNVYRSITGAFWTFFLESGRSQWGSDHYSPEKLIVYSTSSSINTSSTSISSRLPVDSTAVVNYINSLDANNTSY